MPLLTGLSDENFFCLKLYIVKVSGQNGFHGFVDQIVGEVKYQQETFEKAGDQHGWGCSHWGGHGCVE